MDHGDKKLEIISCRGFMSGIAESLIRGVKKRREKMVPSVVRIYIMHIISAISENKNYIINSTWSKMHSSNYVSRSKNRKK